MPAGAATIRNGVIAAAVVGGLVWIGLQMRDDDPQQPTTTPAPALPPADTAKAEAPRYTAPAPAPTTPEVIVPQEAETTPPAPTIIETPVYSGLVEGGFGNTVHATYPGGATEYFYYYADGRVTRRSAQRTLNGRWRRDGAQVCENYSDGSGYCFNDTAPRRAGDRWVVNGITYRIIAGYVTYQPPASPPPPPPSPPPPPPPSPARVAPERIARAQWSVRPTNSQVSQHYPDRARQREREGRVELDCGIRSDGSVSCYVVSEDPSGWGFGEAALMVSRYFRHATTLADGRPTAGARVPLTIEWRLH